MKFFFSLSLLKSQQERSKMYSNWKVSKYSMNYSDQFFLFYFENFTMCSKEQHHWRWRLNLYDGIIYFLMTSGIIVIVIVIEYFKMMWSIIIIINPLAIFILTYCHFLRHFYPRKFAKHHFALSHQCLNVLLFGITRLRLSLERIENRLYIYDIQPHQSTFSGFKPHLGLLVSTVHLDESHHRGSPRTTPAPVRNHHSTTCNCTCTEDSEWEVSTFDGSA